MKLNKGDIILQQGDYNKYLYYIEKGHACVESNRSDQGNNVVATLKENSFFGEISLINPQGKVI